MDFKLSKEQELIQKTVREFAEKYIAPVADRIDRENKVPPEIYKKMAELEIFGIPFSEEVGGTGAGYSCYPLAVEQIARASGGVALTLSVNTLALSAINVFASPEQKKRIMAPCCRGEKIASFAFTEPGTGSDPKQITTTAVRDGDSYILNGTKRFISCADMEGPIVIFAKDDETNYPTGFMLDKFCPGYSVSEPWHKIGMRGGTMTDVYLKDVRVPAADMLGPKGQGYWVLQAGIAFGKIGVSSGALGGMQAALDLCVKYAREKQHRDKTIAKFQGVQMDIARIAEKTEAARWLCYRLGYLAETSKDLRLFAKEAALAKSFVTEAAVDVSRLAVAVHGSYGVMQDYAVERIYRDMIIGEQVEGVADLQRVITASILLG